VVGVGFVWIPIGFPKMKGVTLLGGIPIRILIGFQENCLLQTSTFGLWDPEDWDEPLDTAKASKSQMFDVFWVLFHT